MKEKGQDQVIRPSSIESEEAVGTPALWKSDNFAPDWFNDALGEARVSADVNARRREIVFAVCFAESYIFEWTRRKVQIDELNDYFPATPRCKKDPSYRRNLVVKWREVPKELFGVGKIPCDPKLDLSQLGILVKRRDGLVHAAASRPALASQPNKTKPFPTKDDLERLLPGWALGVVVSLVRSLHKAVGEPVPDYLECL